MKVLLLSLVAASCLFFVEARGAGLFLANKPNEIVITIPGMAPDLPTAKTMAEAVLATTPGIPVVIQLPSAITRLAAAIELTSADSGASASAPLIIRGADDGSTAILGSIPLPNDGTDGNGNMITNLTSHNISVGAGIVARNYGQQGAYSSNFELFQGNLRLHLARWPLGTFGGPNSNNIGLSTDLHYVSGGTGSPVTYTVPTHGVTNWTSEVNLWMGVSTGVSWEWATTPVKTIAGPSTLALPNIASATSTPVSGEGFFIFNSLYELNNSGALGQYVYLTSGNQFLTKPYSGGAQVELAIATRLLHVNSASYITIEKVSLEKTLGAPLTIDTSNNIIIRDSFVGHSGGQGIEVNNGTNVTILRTVVADTSATGINISGGSRTTLTPANHIIQNSIIVDAGVDNLMYHPGVYITGVGISVLGSYLGRSAHELLGAATNNNNTFQNCEFNKAMQFSSDGGASYQGGLTYRGDVFDSNFVHNVGGTSPITFDFGAGHYLDFRGSQWTITNNLWTNMDHAIIINGGRDNTISGNMFMYANPSPPTNTAGAIWFSSSLGTYANELAELAAVPYTTPPWSTQYPNLASMCPAGSCSTADSHPLGNVVSNNWKAGSTAIIGYPIGGDTAYLVDTGTQTSTLTTGQVALFEDPITNYATIENYPSPFGSTATAIVNRRLTLQGLLFAAKAGSLN